MTAIHADPAGRAHEPNPHHLARLLEDAARHIRTHAPTALNRSADWSTPISGTRPGDGRKPRGTHPDPTSHTAINQLDHHRPSVGAWHHELVAQLSWLEDNAHSIIATLTRITTVADLEDRAEMLRQPGAGYCRCCTEHVPGVGDDRIVNGYCPTCKRAWYRWLQSNPHGHRSDFQRTHTHGD